MGIIKRPNVPKDVDSFIAGAPDATHAPAAKPAAAAAPDSGGRKQPISLTIDGALLRDLDAKAAGLGISRAAAISLAVSRFIAQENREANK